jgi:hypothetical protein
MRDRLSEQIRHSKKAIVERLDVAARRLVFSGTLSDVNVYRNRGVPLEMEECNDRLSSCF